ncbi:hypothetical protein A7X67_18265 [Clostridium sp. W14A]|nr:hypothetical protein A7X67_18265 [Clostridium sp. W14A]
MKAVRQFLPMENASAMRTRRCRSGNSFVIPGDAKANVPLRGKTAPSSHPGYDPVVGFWL